VNKEKFIAELNRALGGMSETDRREILYDYEEHFRMGCAEGKSEESIARALGNPRVIGKSYSIDALLETPKEGGEVTAASVLRAVFASASLTFFNIIFVLGPFLGFVAVMIVLWAAAASLPLSGIGLFLSPLAAVIVPAYFNIGSLNPAVLFFAGIGVAAVGLLAVIGMWKLSLLFVRVIASYVKFNMRIVTRRR
jgi:uncharacterized membrane protein